MARSNFNILAFPSHVLDSCSFYRAIGPLSALQRRRPSLQVTVTESVNWAAMSQAGAIMMQRPMTDNQVTIAVLAARQGIPIWVDYDDNLFDVPRDNPAYETHMTPKAHENAINCVKLADIVTVSTEALAKVFRQLHRNVLVVPNALMSNLVGAVPNHGDERNPIVLWRGGNSHQRDIDEFTPEIVAASKTSDHRWLFHGYQPYRTIDGIGARAASAKGVDPLDYFGVLAAMRPEVMIVPLCDHSFNRSKSNIAAIEGIYAGAVPVVPDWPEWQMPGVLRYGDRPSFAAALDKALRLTKEQRHNMWNAGRKFINEVLSIDVVNSRRAGVVEFLERMSFDENQRAAKRAQIAPKLVDRTKEAA